MSRKTPWAKPTSSLPSDRIAPRASPKPAAQPGTGGKVKGKQVEEVKSPEVRKMETQILKLREASLVDPDPKGGCFCRARSHGLSKYTPLCMSCGLVLCAVNLPHHPCPHCFNPLLSPATRDALIVQLDEELASTIAREIAAREKAIEDARIAAGAFPTLSRPSASSSLPGPPHHSSSSSPASTPGRGGRGGAPASHKVLSLTGKNNRVVVSSYTVKPTVQKVSSLNTDAARSEEPLRVPPPPLLPHHATRRPHPERPYENLIGGGGTYAPPPPPPPPEPSEAAQSESKGNRRKRRGKGKEKENANADDVALER